VKCQVLPPKRKKQREKHRSRKRKAKKRRPRWKEEVEEETVTMPITEEQVFCSNGTKVTAQVRRGCGLCDEEAPKQKGSRKPRGERKECSVREPRVLAIAIIAAKFCAVPMRQVQSSKAMATGCFPSLIKTSPSPCRAQWTKRWE
jgi:hypothetical protein